MKNTKPYPISVVVDGRSLVIPAGAEIPDSTSKATPEAVAATVSPVQPAPEVEVGPTPDTVVAEAVAASSEAETPSVEPVAPPVRRRVKRENKEDE